MQKTRKHGSSLFLLEVMIAILFFSVSSAICTQILVKAHMISNEAQELTQAVNACCNAAEMVRCADSPAELESILSDAYESSVKTRQGVEIPLEDGAVLDLRIDFRDSLQKTEIRYVNSAQECVYKLDLQRFFPEVSDT